MTENATTTTDFPGAEVREFITRVDQHGAHQAEIARRTAYAWTRWGHQIDALVRSMPPITTPSYLDECGEDRHFAQHQPTGLHESITRLLAEVVASSDAYAAELRRHAHFTSCKTAEVVALLATAPDDDGTQVDPPDGGP